MKAHRALLFVLVLILPALACRGAAPDFTEGSGTIITRSVDVRRFDQVVLEGSGEVYIEQGSEESLTIEADDNILPLLETRVWSSQLVLGVRPLHDIQPSQPIVYRLTVRDLHEISLQGSGDFYVDVLEANKLKVSIPGSGDVEVKGFRGSELILDVLGSGDIQFEQVHVGDIEAAIQGSGTISLEAGAAESQVVSIYGSGDYRAGGLETSQAEVKIPGSGNLTLWVTQDLKVKVNGGGTVEYYGDPEVEMSGYGSGKLVSLGDK